MLAEEGRQHLEAGGYQKDFYDRPKQPQTTFIKHIDKLTGLLTVFGILRAVIVFAAPAIGDVEAKSFSLKVFGATILSIRMYLLSLMVLVEIIRTTLRESDYTFKFQILIYSLAATTMGMGALFLYSFRQFVYGILAAGVFLGTMIGVSFLLLHSMKWLMTRRTLPFFRRYSTNIVYFLIIMGAVITAMLLKLVKHFFPTIFQLG